MRERTEHRMFARDKRIAIVTVSIRKIERLTTVENSINCHPVAAEMENRIQLVRHSQVRQVTEISYLLF